MDLQIIKGEMKMVYVFLADGFEEIEALGTLDLIRRAGIEALSVSVDGGEFVRGSHGITVRADISIDACTEGAEAVVLPGGMPGAENLSLSSKVRELVFKNFNDGRYIAAICAAPMVFGKMGLLKGKRATCYPGFEKYLDGAEYTGKSVEVDGKVITGNGPGAFYGFAYEIIKAIKDQESADKVLLGGMFNF